MAFAAIALYLQFGLERMVLPMADPVWIQKKKICLFTDPTLHLQGTKATLTTATSISSIALTGHDDNSSGGMGMNGSVTRLCKQGMLKEALHILHAMDKRCIRPDSSIYSSLLQECVNTKALEEGKLIHAHMIDNGLFPDISLETRLVIMYAKCGSLEDARRVFNKMPERNVVSWTAMIAAYTQNGRFNEALEIFRQMQLAGVKPNSVTFASVLPACANLEALEHGRKIHEDIINCGFQSNIFVGNALIDMYAKCARIQDAHKVFDKMPERDVVSWNAMVAGYAQNGHVEEAMELFEKMPERNVISWNGMIAGYAQNGRVDEAMKLFQKTSERNVISWTAMIAGCEQNGHFNEALKMFRQMQQTGVRAASVTFSSVLPTCAYLSALKHGKEAHGYIIRSGFQPDVLMCNALVHMYAKCGTIDDACKVFYKMPERDVVSWNVMIAGYEQNGDVDEAMKLFEKMPERNVISWNAMIAGFAQNGHVDEAMNLFQKMLERNVVSWNAMIAGYAQNGLVDEALKLFQIMPKRGGVSWTSMIAGFEQNGYFNEALNLFRQMQFTGVKPDSVTFSSVVPACANLAALKNGKEVHENIIKRGFQDDIFVGSALVDMYGKCGTIKDASKVFDKMPERGVVSWNAMIAGYTQHGYGEEALRLFYKMQLAGTKVDHFTFATAIRVCVALASLEHGKQIHANIVRCGYGLDVVLGSALVDLYSKWGRIEDARQVFDKISQRNIISWNAMIAGYGSHGLGKESLQLFERMQLEGAKPNHITFLAILSACCYSGLVNEGWHYFDCMSREYDIKPRAMHYACMVEILGQAGRLEDAYHFINKVPIKPTASMWGALLSACRIHVNTELGKVAAERLFDLEPKKVGNYVVLLNIYVAAGRWQDAAKVRKTMEDRGMKQPVCSWIEVKKRLHIFCVGDRSHPQTEEIYALLKKLADEMKEVGYVPNVNFVLHDVEEQEEQVSSYHSEKLAIAFGLIGTPPATAFQIVQNHRICGDCHTATKLITKIVDREIVVKDASRFHRFNDGLCSCGDYW